MKLASIFVALLAVHLLVAPVSANDFDDAQAGFELSWGQSEALVDDTLPPFPKCTATCKNGDLCNAVCKPGQAATCFKQITRDRYGYEIACAPICHCK